MAIGIKYNPAFPAFFWKLFTIVIKYLLNKLQILFYIGYIGNNYAISDRFIIII